MQAGPKKASSNASRQPQHAEEGPPSGGASPTPATRDSNSSWGDYMVPDTGEEVGVLVRSGTYEVDLRKRQVRPCYWPSSRHRVLRGTWFAEKGGEWVPLREALADQLEQAYVSKIWAPSKGLLKETSALAPQDKFAPAVHAARLELNTVVDSGLYSLFVNEDEAYLMRTSSFAWLRRLGASSAAAPTKMRLRRGYAQPATQAALQKEADLSAELLDNAAETAPPTSLLLIVHGIGQTLESANIGQDAMAMRAGLRQVEKDMAQAASVVAAATAGAESFGGASLSLAPLLPQQTGGTSPQGAPSSPGAGTSQPSSSNGYSTGRVEVLPVQWRRTLSLEVDSLAAALRPPGIPSLRQVLHSTAVEVLLYLTPLHRAAIMQSLIASLNSAYARFMLRNPEFKGPVSIMAHSLGSVLCWDILCNQPASAEAATTASATKGSSGNSGDIGNVAGTAPQGGAGSGNAGNYLPTGWSAAPVEITQLSFDVDQLILAGSPLGCFLALRGVDQSKKRGLGTPGSAPLMQCHPDFAVQPDGLPAVQRIYHVFHPYDPVAYRLEPLAYPEAQLSKYRSALVELYGTGGGKRLHIAAQELGDSVSNAATRLGSTIAGAFRRSKSNTSIATAALAVGEGGGGIGDKSPRLAQQGQLEQGNSHVATGVEDQEKKESDIFAGDLDGDGDTAMGREFGRPDDVALSSSACPSTVARIAGGELPPTGGWATSAAGRMDFAIQEASLENQYIAALSAHFVYWASMDVANFVYRAVKG